MGSLEEKLLEQRIKKFEELKELGVEPYPNKFEYSHTISQILERFGGFSSREFEENEKRVKTAGRIMAIRSFGKASFATISDGKHKLQFYIKKNVVDDKTFKIFKLIDIGDIVGVEGRLFRTKTGELTVLVEKLYFLSKCFLPLPEKWHGLTDIELRYRQRYLDLIVNPKVREIFETRSNIIKSIRNFLEERDYIEVETPMMHAIAGGATARPFVTHHNTLDIDLYLRIAPELYLKRLVVGGMERVYEINRNFRNEGISTRHNPEFTMVEFYQAYSDYKDLMDFTEEMFKEVADVVLGVRKFKFGEHEIDLDKWERLSLREAIIKYWDFEGDKPKFEDFKDKEKLKRLFEISGIEFDEDLSEGKLTGILFEEVVEKKLINPTIIYDYPIELSPLSKKKKDEPDYVERFELYIGGMEIANAYSELNDPFDQKERFLQQLKMKEAGDEEAHMMDEDYINALMYGMPPTAGEGIGIDRVTMLFTNSQSIREVILFPLLRPEKKTK